MQNKSSTTGKTPLTTEGFDGGSELYNLSTEQSLEEELWLAAEAGERFKLMELVDKMRVNVNSVNRAADGWTALHYAVNEGKLKCVEFLLQRGANVNQRSGQARTPLHIACSRQNKCLTKILLQNGAQPNLQDEQGNTALHLIAQSNNRDLLLNFMQAAKKGSVDKNVLNADGKSACDMTSSRDIRRVLQPAGSAKPTSESSVSGNGKAKRPGFGSGGKGVREIR